MIVLKKIFLAGNNNPHGPPHHQGNNTFTVQLPGDLEKEAEAKKGITKLMTLCICGDIDLEKLTLSNITYATPSVGMQVVLGSARPAQAAAASDLFRNAFGVIKQENSIDICSSMLNLKIVPKTLAQRILQGNFATQAITLLCNEANSVDPLAFLPQKNSVTIERECTKDMNSCTKLGMDVLDTHKTKVTTSITRIGSMSDMKYITSLCINMNAVLSAITLSTTPEPILKQLLTVIIELTINSDWEQWMELCAGGMPYLHFHFYLFIDTLWTHIADAATDFNNVNVVTESRPLTNLNLKPIFKALKVIKALCDQVTLAQFQGAPITVMALVIAKRSPQAAVIWGPTTVAQPGQLRIPSFSQNPPSTRNNKRTPLTPEKEARPTKSHRAVEKDTSKFVQKDMGMFYLKNTEMRTGDIFPKDMLEKVCAGFTCKGRECTREDCTLVHPCFATDLKEETVLALGRHFKGKSMGGLVNTISGG